MESSARRADRQDRQFRDGTERFGGVATAGHQPHTPGRERLGEGYGLQVVVVGKSSLRDWFAPVLSVIAQITSVVLDPAVAVVILARQYR